MFLNNRLTANLRSGSEKPKDDPLPRIARATSKARIRKRVAARMGGHGRRAGPRSTLAAQLDWALSRAENR
jgi:hypothetical protein